MAKRIQITGKTLERFQKAVPDVEPTSVAAFEMIAINTLPLSKRGTIFHGGKITKRTIGQMAAKLQAGEFVPMHNLHQQGYELPVGRQFYGESVDTTTGETELRSLFYIDGSETALISKVDSGVIDEVSIGLLTEHINCSKCGFDYRGPEATMDHIWDQTCANGHTIDGKDTYVVLDGMEAFFETSFVSLGAGDNAKIVGRSKQIIGKQEGYMSLAADSKFIDEALLLLTATKAPQETEMDLKELVNELSDVKAQLTIANAKNVELSASIVKKDEEITALTTQNTTLTASVNTLTTDLAAAKSVEVKDLEQKVADLTAANTTITETFRTEENRLAIAAGKTPCAVDADVAALKLAIDGHRTFLQETMPVGGVGDLQLKGAKTTDKNPPVSAFKTVKR